jgi:hypothetical protein
MTYSLNTTGHTVTAMTRAMQRVLAFMSENTTQLAYLNDATGRADLEMRIRELDRPRRLLQGYPTNFSMH